MNLDLYRALLRHMPYGKKVQNSVYFHKDILDQMPKDIIFLISEYENKVNEYPNDFNIIKLTADCKISFLCYPNFFKEPHPALKASISINLKTGLITYTDYSKRKSPPILHRKEAFLAPFHKCYKKFKELTIQEDKAGLLSANNIGTKLMWGTILYVKGYKIKNHKLLPFTD